VDYFSCFETLLRHGADPNVNLSSITPLKPFPIFHAFRKPHYALALLNKQCSATIANSKGVAPLCFLASKLLKNGGDVEEEERHIKISEALL